MKHWSQMVCLVFLLQYLFVGCQKQNSQETGPYRDHAFEQQYHQPYVIGNTPEQNDVRSIAVDLKGSVWIATGAGFYRKPIDGLAWTSVPTDTLGPAYAVLEEGNHTVLLGSWNGLFQHVGQQTKRIMGVTGPITQLTKQGQTTFAMGPDGLWKDQGRGFEKINAPLPRSVRDIIGDGQQGLWIASDVGLYHWNSDTLEHFYGPQDLISGYAKGLARDNNGNLWVAGLGGITIRGVHGKEKILLPENGLPSRVLNCLRQGPDSSMWAGTDKGLVRFDSDGSHHLLFSRRWLLSDKVQAMAFEADGTAWIATAQGVSAIRKRSMTLADKQAYFYDILMKRHIRAPWTAGMAGLRMEGDTSTWYPQDDDNDGEFTSNYLAMESFRYAATKSPEAKANAKKAFDFLKQLADITGQDGFFARAMIPISWTGMHDKNREYTPQQKAEERTREPRFKPVEKRWRPSADGQWLWKGDTSSDEMCGHMFGYYHYYTLVADVAEKKRIAQHISKIVDHLMRHDFNLVDVDGLPTRWSIWSPESLNRDPEWLPDRNQNSMEMLSFLKLAYYVSADEKYETAYRRLIDEEGYLQNMSKVAEQNPAWFVYFDVILQAYQYPILLHCEKDPKILSFYKKHLEKWYDVRRKDQNPLIHFIYNHATGNREGLQETIVFLKDTPLDLVDWHIDHSQREDIALARYPSLEEQQMSMLPPASIRQTIRWDVNPWSLKGGDPLREREPVFWLLPYWMGRYLEMIE